MNGQLDDPVAILYVEKHGEFEIARVETWPSVDGPPLVLLTLRACSSGERSATRASYFCARDHRAIAKGWANAIPEAGPSRRRRA